MTQALVQAPVQKGQSFVRTLRCWSWREVVVNIRSDTQSELSRYPKRMNNNPDINVHLILSTYLIDIWQSLVDTVGQSQTV